MKKKAAASSKKKTMKKVASKSVKRSSAPVASYTTPSSSSSSAQKMSPFLMTLIGILVISGLVLVIAKMQQMKYEKGSTDSGYMMEKSDKMDGGYGY